MQGASTRSTSPRTGSSSSAAAMTCRCAAGRRHRACLLAHHPDVRLSARKCLLVPPPAAPRPPCSTHAAPAPAGVLLGLAARHQDASVPQRAPQQREGATKRSGHLLCSGQENPSGGGAVGATHLALPHWGCLPSCPACPAAPRLVTTLLRALPWLLLPQVFQARVMPQSCNGTVVTCAADGLVRLLAACGRGVRGQQGRHTLLQAAKPLPGCPSP